MKTDHIPHYLLFIFLLSLFVASGAYAQNPAPINTIDGGYIKEWLMLGPFFPNDLEKDFLANAGGEANIEPREGDTVTTTEGETLTWKRHKSQSNYINLQDAMKQFLFSIKLKLRKMACQAMMSGRSLRTAKEICGSEP